MASILLLSMTEDGTTALAELAAAGHQLEHVELVTDVEKGGRFVEDQHRRVLCNVDQRNLMSLRYLFDQLGAVVKHTASRQTARVDYHGHVVTWIDLDRQTFDRRHGSDPHHQVSGRFDSSGPRTFAALTRMRSMR